MEKKIIPVILCGGSGSRLWPLSRKSFPKQFLALNNSKYSLLQNTHIRLKGLKNIYDPILVCNEEHRFIVAEQMREINIRPCSILLEPNGRNTAPAITIAILKALELKDITNPTLLVLSSDHDIKQKNKFLELINYGAEFAEQDKLVTFGIIPKSAQTGYGYIKTEKPFEDNTITAQKILEFIEKPNLDNANKFIKDKRFTWNSGIFMFKANTMLKELNKLAPEIVNLCKASILESKKDLDFQRLDKTLFSQCQNLSIDHAVMEKTNKGVVLPLDAGWSDIGSWQALWENSDKDQNGNFIQGRVLNHSSKNCYFSSDKRLIAGIGLKNLIVTETNDAILIADKSQTEKVKEIVKILKEKEFSEAESHSKIYRPWGHYISIAGESGWQVKMIEVKPNGKLSIQMHHHRSEHWVVVKGRAKVEIEDKVDFLSENQSTYIPLGSKHRLSNPGKIPLLIIEIQSGSYIGEDDIVRFEDIYGRID